MDQLTLRPLTQDDLPFVAEVRHRPETLRWLHDGRTFSLEEMRHWYERTRPPWRLILIEGCPAGYFRVSDVDEEHKSIKIGADIHPDLRRRGIATAAYRQFVRELLNQGWRRIWLEVLEDNQVAIRLYRRLGFREDGRRPQAVQRDGHWQDSILMSLLNTRVTGRSVKVIVLYLGDRRASPANAREALPMLRFLLAKERTVDPGESLDTVLVYHRVEPAENPNARPYIEEAEALLRAADGSPTHSGTLRVLTRPNVGLSFGGYDFAFSLFADAYDYWLFTEDDQIVVKDGYMRRAIGQLERDTDVGFVAFVGVSQSVFHPHHAHGGVGVASRTVLQQVKAANTSPTDPHGHLPYHISQGYSNQELLGEIRFTNAIDQLGYRLVDLDDEEVVVGWGQTGRRTPRLTPWREEMAWEESDSSGSGPTDGHRGGCFPRDLENNPVSLIAGPRFGHRRDAVASSAEEKHKEIVIMNLPPCHSRRDVDPAKEIYFCAHPQMHVQNQLVTPPICRACPYWQQPPPATFRVMPSGPLIRDQPCQHLGEAIELRDCATCSGSVKLKVFACGHPAHGKTTLPECQVCPDYALPESEAAGERAQEGSA